MEIRLNLWKYFPRDSSFSQFFCEINFVHDVHIGNRSDCFDFSDKIEWRLLLFIFFFFWQIRNEREKKVRDEKALTYIQAASMQ